MQLKNMFNSNDAIFKLCDQKDIPSNYLHV